MTGTNFEIPVTSQERNVAAKFQPVKPIMETDGRPVRDDNTLSGIADCEFQIR